MTTIGLIGTGTIGSGVIEIYQKNLKKLSDHVNGQIKIKTICDLSFDNCSHDISEFNTSSNWEELVNDPEIEIVVELIGGEEPAKSIIEAALKQKKSVVTANKLVMAKHGTRLLKIAEKNDVNILYEAAVCGAIPIISPLKTTLVPNNIKGIYGIVNGTTNYILSKMHQEDVSYADVLKEAQDLGYAESDPSSDVDGYDSQYKLAILASIAYKADVSYKDILLEGITKISDQDIKHCEEFGKVIKLLAIANYRDDQLELRVHPVLLDKGHPLASVNGAYNAVYVVGDAVGDLMFYGAGAGSVPTASSIWADILDIANDTPYKMDKLQSIKIAPHDTIMSEYYMRIRVKDHSGVLAEISSVFAKNDISIKTASQKGLGDDAELVIITHTVSEKSKNLAVSQIKKLDCVNEISSIIRVGI